MRYILIYILPTTLIAALLLFYMKPLSLWLGNFIYPTVENVGENKVVGTVQEVSGQVTLSQSSGKKPLAKGDSVHNYDRIEVADKSHVNIKFPSQYTLKFLANSQFLVELWDQKKKETSPIYIYIKYGEHQMIQEGKKGRLFLIKNNRQFSPEETIQPQKPLKLATPTDPSQESPSNPSQSPMKESYPTTESIEKIVQSEITQFEKCLINHSNNPESLSGELLVGFSILNTGGVQGVETIKSQIKNKSFERCILDVFRKLIFQPFHGQSIDFTYPLKFK